MFALEDKYHRESNEKLSNSKGVECFIDNGKNHVPGKMVSNVILVLKGKLMLVEKDKGIRLSLGKWCFYLIKS